MANNKHLYVDVGVNDAEKIGINWIYHVEEYKSKKRGMVYIDDNLQKLNDYIFGKIDESPFEEINNEFYAKEEEKNIKIQKVIENTIRRINNQKINR